VIPMQPHLDAWLPRLQVAAVLSIAPLAAFAKNGSVAALLLLAAVALVERRRLAFALDPPLAWALAACFAWMLLSAAWSERPQPQKVLGLALVAVCALYLLASLRELSAARLALLRKAFWSMAGLALALLLVQFAFDFPLLRLLYGELRHNSVDGNLGLIVPLFWPVAASLVRASGRALVGPLFAAAVALVVAIGPMDAAVAAMICGLASFLLVWLMPRLGPALVVSGFIVYGAAAPVISSQWATLEAMGAHELEAPKSWERRVGMWTIAARTSLEHPLAGIGFRNARDLGETVTRREGDLVRVDLHPHNAALEIWLELGLVGAALFAALLAALVRPLRSLAGRDRLVGAAATAALATWLTVALLSFSLWQTWWQSAGWLVAFAVTVLAADRADQPT